MSEIKGVGRMVRQCHQGHHLKKVEVMAKQDECPSVGKALTRLLLLSHQILNQCLLLYDVGIFPGELDVDVSDCLLHLLKFRDSITDVLN